MKSVFKLPLSWRRSKNEETKKEVAKIMKSVFCKMLRNVYFSLQEVIWWLKKKLSIEARFINPMNDKEFKIKLLALIWIQEKCCVWNVRWYNVLNDWLSVIIDWLQ